MQGWGGQLSGMEISNGGSTLTQATTPQAGLWHTAIYYSKKNEQLLFVDGKLVMSYSNTPVVNATLGYFAFSVFESSLLLGAVGVYTL
jgi:hypothetical protein